MKSVNINRAFTCYLKLPIKANIYFVDGLSKNPSIHKSRLEKSRFISKSRLEKSLHKL